MIKPFKIYFQQMLPQHFLSRLVAKLANCRISWLKNFLINIFIKYYGVTMQEAAEPNPNNYADFNSFFTRALKNNARSITLNPQTILSPVDGQISQFGIISAGKILQAKGKDFSVEQLLADVGAAKDFLNGSFITLYLAPKDYHRVHMPVAARLQKMLYVPGKLFSVNRLTSEYVQDLYARNERVVTIFEVGVEGAVAETKFKMAMVLVGAMIVAGIETSWAGQVMPQDAIQNWDYAAQNITLAQTVEMGRFKLGSTVLLLFPPNIVTWHEELKIGGVVRMGEILGQIS
jgi:phosphatidylserine decarboxylase